VRRHTLSDTALGALGAGRPDAATPALLRRAANDRHLLLVRELVRAAPVPTRRWYAGLRAAERTAPGRTRARIADPLFGAWAAHGLRTLRRGEPWPGDPVHEGGGRGRVLTAEHDGLVLAVRLEDRDPRRGLLGLEPAGPLTGDEVAHWQRCLDDAWRLLLGRHRDAALVLAAVLEMIVPVRPDPAARGISASSADAYGAVAMSAPEDGVALAVGLLHEVQHSVLNAVLHLFDLLEAPGTPGYSPWRDDPRPVSGLLHGAYAYLTVTRFWRAEAAATGDRLAAFEFARWREAVAGAAERVLRDGRPTAAGTRFVGALLDEVRPWRDEPVDPEAERLARLANADHRLRWRLRNLAVPPEQAEALAAAWRRGDPPPAVESRLVPAPRRALENSDRLNRMHAALRRDAAGAATARGATTHLPGGGAAAGDDALLAGDHGTARSAYRKGVVSEPADDASWTGLALLTDRLERLEVVVAGYRALPDRPDPLAFARWISG
jgi:hypothetical protein